MQFKIIVRPLRLLRLPLSLIMLTHAQWVFATASCTINVIPFSFGSIVTNGPNIDSDSGSVSITCTGTVTDNGLTITTRLSPGSSSTGYAPRKLSFGPHSLNYNLYLSPNRLASSVWGDGTNNTMPSNESIADFNAMGDPRTRTIIIYGRIFANQLLKPAGLYTDSIIVSVTF